MDNIVTNLFTYLETWMRPETLTRFLPHIAAIAFLLFCLVVLVLQRKRRESETRLALETDAARDEAGRIAIRLEERNDRLEEAGKRIALLERNLLEASQEKSALAARLEETEKRRREQALLMEQSEARLRDAFGALSREALDKNNEMFLSLAGTKFGELQKGAEAELEAKKIAVDSLVKPIGQTLEKMDAALAAAERSRSQDHASFSAVQQTLAETTGRLVRALHHSAARGRWGELQLRRVVEMAGMLEHCDFEEQVTVGGEGGRRLRPDLVIRLVGGRTIVVDAKTPMDSYLQAQEAESDRDEQDLRRKHAKAVKAHMTELGAKSYWNQFEDTPEFVVMFFPNEAVFADAMRIDPGLMEHGMTNQVIPASPATLIALLKAAAYGWQQERAAENARYIFDLGRQLHDRFNAEYRHLAGVGTALGKAVEQFNRCVGSADRMLFPALRRFGELTEKELFPPPSALEEQPRSLAATAEEADA
ncbi:MAG: DNA recombination protein RmuC [Planctomycetota bacterium]|nr:DNA recombination protein RmuC [Planctomycetota bacterium]